MTFAELMTDTGFGSCLLLAAALGLIVRLIWQGRKPR